MGVTSECVRPDGPESGDVMASVTFDRGILNTSGVNLWQLTHDVVLSYSPEVVAKIEAIEYDLRNAIRAVRFDLSVPVSVVVNLVSFVVPTHCGTWSDRDIRWFAGQCLVRSMTAANLTCAVTGDLRPATVLEAIECLCTQGKGFAAMVDGVERKATVRYWRFLTCPGR